MHRLHRNLWTNICGRPIEFLVVVVFVFCPALLCVCVLCFICSQTGKTHRARAKRGEKSRDSGHNWTISSVSGERAFSSADHFGGHLTARLQGCCHLRLSAAAAAAADQSETAIFRFLAAPRNFARRRHRAALIISQLLLSLLSLLLLLLLLLQLLCISTVGRQRLISRWLACQTGALAGLSSGFARRRSFSWRQSVCLRAPCLWTPLRLAERLDSTRPGQVSRLASQWATWRVAKKSAATMTAIETETKKGQWERKKCRAEPSRTDRTDARDCRAPLSSLQNSSTRSRLSLSLSLGLTCCYE